MGRGPVASYRRQNPPTPPYHLFLKPIGGRQTSRKANNEAPVVTEVQSQRAPEGVVAEPPDTPPQDLTNILTIGCKKKKTFLFQIFCTSVLCVSVTVEN